MGGIVTILKRSVSSFGNDRCATLSAAIAYYTVFAIFPIALFGISVLGFFVGGAVARQEVVKGITRIVPLGESGVRSLNDTLKGINQAKGILGLLGIAGAAWSASGLFGAIRRALDVVWDVDRPRPLLRAKAVDLLLFIVFGGLIGISAASTGLLQAGRAAGGDFLGPLLNVAPPLFVLLTIAVPLVSTFAAFMFLYRVAPHARLGWQDVWPSAVIAALFFEFGKTLLTFYLVKLSNFNALAGSLGVAIFFLVFIYYASQVVLFAAELSKHRMLVRHGTVPAEDPKPAAAPLPFGRRLKRMLLGLWVVEAPDHDLDLPYRPARIDPETDQPANTAEEVLLQEREALHQAAVNGSQRRT